MSTKHVLARAAGIGAVAGLRSMMGPAMVAQLLHIPGSPRARNVLTLLAAGELVADKLPFVPNRTSRGPLVARLVSGALCGAAVSSSARKPVAAGAAADALGALAGAFVGFEARRRAAKYGFAAAALEDAVAIAGARLAVSAS